MRKLLKKELDEVTYVLFMIFLFSIFLSFLFYQFMPEKMAMHFSPDSKPDSFVSKQIALFIMPLTILFLTILFIIIPKIDPLRQNIKKFQRIYEIFFILLNLFMLYIFALIILFNLGFNINISSFVVPPLLVLFYFVGLMIEKSRQNWFIGIRTPWTLTDKEVWKKTNKLGGKMFRILSALLFLLFFFTNTDDFYFIFVSLMIVFLVFAFFYSYFIYKRQ